MAVWSAVIRNITASSGTVAVEHDWHASGAILKGTARELNGLLKKSGITFKSLVCPGSCAENGGQKKHPNTMRK